MNSRERKEFERLAPINYYPGYEEKIEYNSELRKNSEGYPDPTAYLALSKIANSEADTDKKHSMLIHVIYCICNISGFDLEGRVVLRDRKSGRLFK